MLSFDFGNLTLDGAAMLGHHVALLQTRTSFLSESRSEEPVGTGAHPTDAQLRRSTDRFRRRPFSFRPEPLHPEGGFVMIGRPVFFNPAGARIGSRARVGDSFERLKRFWPPK